MISTEDFNCDSDFRFFIFCKLLQDITYIAKYYKSNKKKESNKLRKSS